MDLHSSKYSTLLDHKIKIWDLGSLQEVQTLDGHCSDIWYLSLSEVLRALIRKLPKGACNSVGRTI